MPTKLYVGNLAYSVTNEDLEALFSQAGKVESDAYIVGRTESGWAGLKTKVVET